MPKAKLYRQLTLEFTPTEHRIKEWICRGLDNKTIAGHLRTSEQVVKNMVGRMFDKVGCSNRIEFFLMTHNGPAEIQHDLEVEELELEQRLVIVRKKLAFIKGVHNENEARTYTLAPHPGGLAGAHADLGQGRN